MPDIIQLLPDAVANQIAAGEVVQRPASAVKELLENAVDAGATEIKLIVKDAGKTLIQVIDDGCGMSDTDARLSFERHATSKIRKAEELFQIRTKGFRGEALASIAAIAHVEMKSRMRENELGTKIQIAGSEVSSQEPCAAPCGTSISIKNLFYNVPARRNFLKSDSVEMRHIIEEFERVALAHPDVGFTVHHNNAELFNIKSSPLRQRIVNMFGSRYNERLVPVREETAIVSVMGFIGKPEFAKKTRGEQYFFVNDRYIKNSYLNHAVTQAFDELVSRGSHPSYFLYLKVDPSTIDVNIHPTKTEIKFTEERSIYAIIHSAVRNSLGKYNIAPSLDFDQEDIFNVAPMPQNMEVAPPEPKDYDFNPFEQGAKPSGNFGGGGRSSSGSFPTGWKDLYAITKSGDDQQPLFDREESEIFPEREAETRPVFQLHGKYICTTIKSGLIIIDQQRAHERILYEDALNNLENQGGYSQQQLFPQTVELSNADCALINDLSDDMHRLGFTIDNFGGNEIVINGIPTEAANIPVQGLIENFLEQYKNTVNEVQSNTRDRLARSLARSLCIREGKRMQRVEMLDLIDKLFACKQPQAAPNGKPTILTFANDELDKKFKA
ncbi:DNA mismatch repair endonuclease MutL [Cryomorpha ignava]|uniref:DNA mismatch repair protein MutL n=1 Tax=Cryomorpha ignava TaxID=101383 RepID=A0A7K3WSI0_9FLAO|nr:DNA mismatch repair endonuclease MutL [Cryomorpha ignava]NEN24650.1 DNA mismatch repair endonuclease MutL [Cryomorpha ignava]